MSPSNHRSIFFFFYKIPSAGWFVSHRRHSSNLPHGDKGSYRVSGHSGTLFLLSVVPDSGDASALFFPPAWNPWFLDKQLSDSKYFITTFPPEQHWEPTSHPVPGGAVPKVLDTLGASRFLNLASIITYFFSFLLGHTWSLHQHLK